MTLNQIQEYICVHRPQAAYLGRIEMDAMRSEAETGLPESHRIIYCECSLYQVDAVTHAGFQSRHNAEAIHPESKP